MGYGRIFEKCTLSICAAREHNGSEGRVAGQIEDGEIEELDRGLRAKREGRNMSWLTPFQGLGYAIICLFPFICRRKEDFCRRRRFQPLNWCRFRGSQFKQASRQSTVLVTGC